MKRVLFVEDDGLIYDTIEKKLIENFKTERVSSYAAAKGRWGREEENYDCIVLDLQINPLGLELDQIDLYTPLYGLAVLEAFTEGKSDDQKRKIRKKTIIYSGFTSTLYSGKFDLKDLLVISKSAGSIKEVVRKIMDICSES